MCCPPAVNICGALYSIRTSSRDDRCLVYSENNLWICLYSDCKDVRAAYVSSDRAMEFTCQHIKQVPDSVRVLDMYNITAAKIAAYPCDAPTKSILYNISIPLGREAVYKVSDRTYLVYGPPSATNTLGFCHIKVDHTKKAGTAFHNSVVKVLFRRQNKRSRVLSVSIFMFSFAHWNCTRTVILTPLLHLCPLHHLKLQAHLSKSPTTVTLHHLKLPLCLDCQH